MRSCRENAKTSLNGDVSSQTHVQKKWVEKGLLTFSVYHLKIPSPRGRFVFFSSFQQAAHWLDILRNYANELPPKCDLMPFT